MWSTTTTSGPAHFGLTSPLPYVSSAVVDGGGGCEGRCVFYHVCNSGLAHSGLTSPLPYISSMASPR